MKRHWASAVQPRAPTPSLLPASSTTASTSAAAGMSRPSGADDAKSARPFGENNLPKPLVFDHAQILRDYFDFKRTGQRPKP